MELSLSQRFELERMKRTIDETESVEELREIAKKLLEAWQSQKAATQWAMRQALGSAPRAKTAENQKV